MAYYDHETGELKDDFHMQGRKGLEPNGLLGDMSAKELCILIERRTLLIVKSGYRWRGPWEVRVPAPGGHYCEENERRIASGCTVEEALAEAIKVLGL